MVLLASCRIGFDAAPQSSPDADTVDVPDGFARIEVEHVGAAAGTVLGSNGFTCTMGACVLAVPIGTSVWLRGVVASDAWFAGWTGKCGGNFECRFDASGDVTIQAEFSPLPNRTFVTSTTTDGAFGGIAGADAICSARATAAGLTGNFVAYVSDSTATATSRLASSRGWVRVDGAPFADAPTAFSNGQVVFPIRFDEYGNDLGTVTVFTGTAGGTAAPKHCLDWTSNLATEGGAGTLSQFASAAMDGGSMACDQQRHLLCVETGRTVPVLIHPDLESPLAFATRALWTPGGGRASADAVCAADAASAGLPGTFLATVATSTESIASRFAPGAVYRRIDGVRLLRDPGLFTTDYLDVPPDRDPIGGLVSNDYWTGVLRWNTPAQLTSNCSDWTDGGATVDGEMHYTAFTDLRSSAKREPCATPLPLLCLQR